MEKYKWLITAALITLGVLAVRVGVYTGWKNDISHEFVKVQDAKQDGYELQPGYVKLTASHSKMMADASKEGWFQSLAILSIILCFFPFPWIWWGNGLNKTGPVWLLVAGLLLWFTVSFAPLAYISTKVEYETKICLRNFEEGKNYDYLFPETNVESLTQFLKTCK